MKISKDIAFIKSFEWITTENNITLTAIFLTQTRTKTNPWPDTTKEFNEIKIRFEKVSALKLNFPAHTCTS